MTTSPETGTCKGAETSALWLLAAALYFLLAASTIHLTSDGSTIATVWPANAVLVALLLLGPPPRWATVLSAGMIGNVAANYLTRGSITGPLLYSLANGIEVVIAVLLIRADAGRAERARATERLLRFVCAAGVIAPLTSAMVGAATARTIYGQPFGDALVTWLLSDALGLLVFVPVFVSLFNGELVECITSKTARRRIESLGLIALTGAITWLIFVAAPLPALFMLYAPVMLVTFRVGPLGTKMAVMTIAVIGAYATATGSGPVVMVTADPVAQAHYFQATLAVMLLTCLPVAAAVAERTRLAAELATRERKAIDEAITDPLTGVLNRRGFERAAQELMAGERAGLCFVVIDVDRFKQVNDRWGHRFGDAVLRHIAATLRANTRPGDLVGRVGGDEFALLARAGDRASIEAVCARIQAALRGSPLAPDPATVFLAAISCGAAHVRGRDRFEDAYGRADTALYAAKRAGRDTMRLAHSA